jgi:hypothetical protein
MIVPICYALDFASFLKLSHSTKRNKNLVTERLTGSPSRDPHISNEACEIN